jgi:hypothetical protein
MDTKALRWVAETAFWIYAFPELEHNFALLFQLIPASFVFKKCETYYSKKNYRIAYQKKTVKSKVVLEHIFIEKSNKL